MEGPWVTQAVKSLLKHVTAVRKAGKIAGLIGPKLLLKRCRRLVRSCLPREVLRSAESARPFPGGANK